MACMFYAINYWLFKIIFKTKVYYLHKSFYNVFVEL